MSNPDSEGRTPEQNGEPKGARGSDEIRLRDFDKIQERRPFTLRPVHIRIAIAGALVLIVAAVATGWFLGRGAAEAPTHVAKVIIPEKIQPPVQETREPEKHRSVRGSVLPAAEPVRRGSEGIQPERRGPEIPEIDETPDWLVAALAGGCFHTCLMPDCECENEAPVECAPARETDQGPDALGETDAGNNGEPVPDASSDVVDAGKVGDAQATADAVVHTDAAPQAAADAVVHADAAPQATDTAIAAKDATAAGTAPAGTGPSVIPAAKPVDVKKVDKTEPAKSSPPQKEPPQKKFSVQIRSFKEKAVAREFAGIIRSKGYNAFIVTYVDPNGLTWYRVRTGRFATASEAAAFASELNAKEGEKSIPVEAK